MKKRNKKSITKIILAISAVLFMFYVGSIFYNRNFRNDNAPLMEEKNEQTELEKLKNRTPLNTKIPLPEENMGSNKDTITEQERVSQFEISLEDCNSECVNYKEINKLNYCQQVCGLIPINKTTNKETVNNTCESLTGLEKDYCWRNEAINETNFEKCQKIEDENIYKQCKNRVMEDIIDSQL